MRRILICVLLGIMTSAPLTNAQDQNTALANLSQLSRHNQLPQLIQAANSLLANQKLEPAERGIALTYLGHAYQKGGDFQTATGYYEKALAILERDGLHPSEYATTLGALATLYAEMGQMDTAKHVLLRSMHLFENDRDHHDQIAILWSDLATIAADKHSSREAHKCMALAIAETQRATNVSPDETSALLTTQARIAQIDGDPRTAIADYQHALDLWKQSHADQHPDTGWLYVLLGGAYLQAGDLAGARDTTHRGLSVLQASSGPQSPRFFAAELAYAKVLEASGSHDEASRLRKEAEAGLHASPARQQAQSEISISALR
jgi:tetratricopeptide (TPR) repeat protein